MIHTPLNREIPIVHEIREFISSYNPIMAVCDPYSLSYDFPGFLDSRKLTVP